MAVLFVQLNSKTYAVSGVVDKIYKIKRLKKEKVPGEEHGQGKNYREGLVFPCAPWKALSLVPVMILAENYVKISKKTILKAAWVKSFKIVKIYASISKPCEI